MKNLMKKTISLAAFLAALEGTTFTSHAGREHVVAFLAQIDGKDMNADSKARLQNLVTSNEGYLSGLPGDKFQHLGQLALRTGFFDELDYASPTERNDLNRGIVDLSDQLSNTKTELRRNEGLVTAYRQQVSEMAVEHGEVQAQQLAEFQYHYGLLQDENARLQEALRVRGEQVNQLSAMVQELDDNADLSAINALGAHLNAPAARAPLQRFAAENQQGAEEAETASGASSPLLCDLDNAEGAGSPAPVDQQNSGILEFEQPEDFNEEANGQGDEPSSAMGSVETSPENSADEGSSEDEEDTRKPRGAGNNVDGSEAPLADNSTVPVRVLEERRPLEGATNVMVVGPQHDGTQRQETGASPRGPAAVLPAPSTEPGLHAQTKGFTDFTSHRHDEVEGSAAKSHVTFLPQRDGAAIVSFNPFAGGEINSSTFVVGEKSAKPAASSKEAAGPAGAPLPSEMKKGNLGPLAGLRFGPPPAAPGKGANGPTKAAAAVTGQPNAELKKPEAAALIGALFKNGGPALKKVPALPERKLANPADDDKTPLGNQ